MKTSPTASTEYLDLARKVLEIEAQAILNLIPTLDGAFERALELLHACKGRVIVTGMGKSGKIADKLAATLSSTGTPAIFLHAAEAVHGDLGVIQTEDVVVALSYGGETREIVALVEGTRRIGAKLVALTGHAQSTLGQAADATLSCEVAMEACPMNLAPTASTTATLALGDALAMALLRRKGFREEQFASLHPGGRIGKKLLRVETVMKTGADLPKVSTSARMPDVVREMSAKGLGITCVVGDGDRLAGVVTDGDLRRHLVGAGNLLERSAGDIMSTHPVTIDRQMLAVDVLRLMEERKITAVIVVDANRKVEGIVHLHGLWRTQMV